MHRTLAALAALALSAGAARAADEVDPKTQALIQAAVEKATKEAVAKAEERIRADVRSDVQNAQIRAESDATTAAAAPKLQFLELDGYLRVRSYYLDDLDLDVGPDSAGRFLFPRPLQNTGSRGTFTGTNMRLRIEPILNVSEQVRVRAQFDVFDNYAFGSNASALADQAGSPFPVPLYGSSHSFLLDDKRVDRAAILAKRAWAEVQTPVGLLSFGRMPIGWGLGILQNAGGGLDDDFGDTVDRVQFAIQPVQTLLGPLTIVPSLDWNDKGAQRFDPLGGPPLDADNWDDATTWGIKVARLDTDDELKRKVERGESSLNYGAFYQYKAQSWVFPGWVTSGTGAPLVENSGVQRNAVAHVLDLWGRFVKGPVKVEVEAAGIGGHVGNADPTGTGATPQLLLRQWGLAANVDFAAMPNKLSVGLDGGVASGDSAPGFGYATTDPTTGAVLNPTGAYGVLQGQQYGVFDGRGDRTIRNFSFNPAYRVDVILFRQIIGGVTDAYYVKPKLRWSVMPGLALDAAVVWSSALSAESTPSSWGAGKGHKPLGIEGDAKLTYGSGDGFNAWIEYGILQPLDGLRTLSGGSLDRAHAIHVGFAAKF
jgi:uncharacterized protein (TIGR04551 family)